MAEVNGIKSVCIGFAVEYVRLIIVICRWFCGVVAAVQVTSGRVGHNGGDCVVGLKT